MLKAQYVVVLHSLTQINLFPDQPDPASNPGPAADLLAERPLRRRVLDLVHSPARGRAR